MTGDYDIVSEGVGPAPPGNRADVGIPCRPEETLIRGDGAS